MAANFAFPKIKIDWSEINAQQFENSRAHIMEKLDYFMANKEFASVSRNVFTRDEMYVLHELLKAAHPVRT